MSVTESGAPMEADKGESAIVELKVVSPSPDDIVKDIS